jgi:hypothetical protein
MPQNVYLFGPCRIYDLKYSKDINPIKFFEQVKTTQILERVSKHYTYNIFQIVNYLERLLIEMPEIFKMLDDMEICVIENCTIYNMTNKNKTEHYLKFQNNTEKYVTLYNQKTNMPHYYLIHPDTIIDIKNREYLGFRFDREEIKFDTTDTEIICFSKVDSIKLFFQFSTYIPRDFEFSVVIESKVDNKNDYFLKSYINDDPKLLFDKVKITNEFTIVEIKMSIHTSPSKTTINIDLCNEDSRSKPLRWIIRKIELKISDKNIIPKKKSDDIVSAIQTAYNHNELCKCYEKLRMIIPKAKIILVPHLISDRMNLFAKTRREEIANMLINLASTYDNTFYFNLKKYTKESMFATIKNGTKDYNHYNKKGLNAIGKMISNYISQMFVHLI